MSSQTKTVVTYVAVGCGAILVVAGAVYIMATAFRQPVYVPPQQGGGQSGGGGGGGGGGLGGIIGSIIDWVIPI